MSMTLDELRYLECTLCDHICEAFEAMPDNGTVDWGLRKMDLIKRVRGELDNMEISE